MPVSKFKDYHDKLLLEALMNKRFGYQENTKISFFLNFMFRRYSYSTSYEFIKLCEQWTQRLNL